MIYSWSQRFLASWSRHLTLVSTLRFWHHQRQRARGGAPREGLLQLDLKAPVSARIHLRRNGADDGTLTEIFQEQVYADVVNVLGTAEYVVDLGANIGLAALFFACQFPRCQVFAVEPDPRNYDVLLKNTSQIIDAGRCRPLRAAVWNENIALAVAMPSESEFNNIQVGVAGAGAAVDGMTMTGLLSRCGFPHIDLLKVDIEGAEVQLFDGDVSWLERVRAIAIEFHGHSRTESRFDETMDEFGFSVVRTAHHTVVARRTSGT